MDRFGVFPAVLLSEKGHPAYNHNLSFDAWMLGAGTSAISWYRNTLHNIDWAVACRVQSNCIDKFTSGVFVRNPGFAVRRNRATDRLVFKRYVKLSN